MDHLQELKPLKQWVNYILQPRKDGSFSKPPINPRSLQNGSSTDPEQWTDYKTASGNIGKAATFRDNNGNYHTVPIQGTGIIINGNYAGIDLDHVLSTDGQIKAPFVKELLESLDTYAEISVSGTGLHLLFHADDIAQDLGGKFSVDKNGDYSKSGEYEIEIYRYKRGGRYLTVSENPFPGYDRPISRNKGKKLQEVFTYYETQRNRNNVQTEKASPPPVGSLLPEEADSTVLEKMFRSKKGDKLRRLYSGDISDYGNNHSNADQGFINDLTYWCNGNAEQIDRIFRSSGLMRDKWDRPIRRGADTTYGQQTIEEALKDHVPFVPGSGFTAEERREYGRQKHAQETAERQKALDINNLYLDDLKGNTEPPTESQEHDLPDPNNHNGYIAESYWQHWEYTRAVIRSRGQETEYRSWKDFRSAWDQIHKADTDSTVTFFMKPSQKEIATQAPEQEPDIDDVIKPIGNYIDGFIEDCQNPKPRHSTGFLSLDKRLNGGLFNELYLLNAETSTGKSAIAMTIAQNLTKSGMNVLYFAMEMSRNEFIARGASAISYELTQDEELSVTAADILYYHFREDVIPHNIDPFVKIAYSKYAEYVEEYRRRYADSLFIIERPQVRPSSGKEIANVCRKFYEKHPEKPIAVFIDYLQILEGEETDRKTKTDKAILDLKELCTQLQIPVFVLSSIGRSGYKQGADLGNAKESGDLEYTAGIALGWDWDGVTNYYSKDKTWRDSNEPSDQKKKDREVYHNRCMLMSLLKNRNSDRDSLDGLIYYPQYNYFREVDKDLDSQRIKDEEAEGNVTLYDLLSGEVKLPEVKSTTTRHTRSRKK